jgi:hypothetical protein
MSMSWRIVSHDLAYPYWDEAGGASPPRVNVYFHCSAKPAGK